MEEAVQNDSVARVEALDSEIKDTAEVEILI